MKHQQTKPEDGRMKQNRIFTLIELLVVIAVIAILVSLLLPALGKAREMGKQISCASQLSQQGLGFQMYLDDYNSYFPNIDAPEIWMINLNDHYLHNQSLFKCPSENEKNFEMSRHGVSYGYNYRYLSNADSSLAPSYPQMKLTFIKNPANVLVVCDSDGQEGSGNYSYAVCFYCYSATARRASTRHNRGSNVLFADNHVKHARKSELDPPSANDDYWHDPQR